MTWLPIPFNKPMSQNTPANSSDDSTTLMMDVYIDEDGNVCKRPGLTLDHQLAAAAPVDGMFYWEEKAAIVEVSGGRIYANGVDITGDGLLLLNAPVFFATNSKYLIMANGGRMVTWQGGADLTAYVASAAAPVAVSSVSVLDNYIIATVTGQQEVEFSDATAGVESPVTWAYDFFSPEFKTDKVLQARVMGQAVYIFGSRSIEIWYDDGVTPFTRAGVVDRGLGAKRGVVEIDGTLAWIDQNRQIVALNGQQAESRSMKVQKTLDRMTAISDCIVSRCDINGKRFAVFSFPSAHRTFAYCVELNYWVEWGFWDQGNNRHVEFLGAISLYRPDLGVWQFGDRSAGNVYTLDETQFQDNGMTLKSVIHTAYFDHGASNWKFCREMRFRIRRGVGAVDTDSYFMLSYRSDGNPTQTVPVRAISLGMVGDYFTTRREFLFGRFRTRQWMIEHTDNCAFELSTVEADLEASET